MGQNTLMAEPREGTGKGVARKLRQAGRIPAVLYGRGRPSELLQLDPEALEQLIHSESGMNTLIDLEVRGRASGSGERVVLVKELQRDPVRGIPLHVDLYHLDLENVVEVSVPIHLTGRPMGVELHDGILDHSLRELELSCLPRDIPEALEVDVAALDVGDTLHVRDLSLPGGVELRSDPDLSVASVVAARVVEEEAPAEGLAVEGEGAPEAAEGAEPAAGDAAAEKSGDGD